MGPASLHRDVGVGHLQSTEQSLWAIWKTPFRKRLLMLALIWAASYVASQNAIAFWKEFAVHERGFSDAQVGASIVIAAVVSLPLVFASGWLDEETGEYLGRPVDVVQFIDGSILVSDDLVGAVYRISYEGVEQTAMR